MYDKVLPLSQSLKFYHIFSSYDKFVILSYHHDHIVVKWTALDIPYFYEPMSIATQTW